MNTVKMTYKGNPLLNGEEIEDYVNDKDLTVTFTVGYDAGSTWSVNGVWKTDEDGNKYFDIYSFRFQVQD